MKAQNIAGNVCLPLHRYSFQDMLNLFTNVNSTSQTNTRPYNLNSTQIILLFRPTMQTVLLYFSGDIETNPGQTVQNELCFAHINARSIKNKVDLLEAESNNFDIISLSETWLSHSDRNSSIYLPNFHKPVRLERPNDTHGRVAIYVKNYPYCKARPDLHVNNMEAVWVWFILVDDCTPFVS